MYEYSKKKKHELSSPLMRHVLLRYLFRITSQFLFTEDPLKFYQILTIPAPRGVPSQNKVLSQLTRKT